MRVITLGSGSTQTGKSFLAANLGVALAQRGMRCCLVDLDLASADLHLMTGCLNPQRTVAALLRGRILSLAEASVPVPGCDGLRLIPGPRETLRSSSLSEREIARLGSEILRLPAEIVLVDLEAGEGQQLLDLFLMGDYQWVVSTTSSASIDAASGLQRLARLRRTARGSASGQSHRPRIYTSLDDLVKDMSALRDERLPAKDGMAVCSGVVLNRTGAGDEDLETRLLEGILSTGHAVDDTPIMAEIPEDPAVAASIRALEPLCLRDPQAPAVRAIRQLACSLVEELTAGAASEGLAMPSEPALV